MADPVPNRLCDVLLTASEAYPTLERAFLSAKTEVSAGFRVFDPDTALTSAEGFLVGKTWADLVAHVLDHGVRLTFILSDFDPVVRLDMHRYAWKCLHRLKKAAARSRHPELLTVRTSLHPSRVGILPRLVLWPRLHNEIRDSLAPINAQPIAARRAFMDETPLIPKLVKWRGDQLVPRLRPPALVPVTHHQKLAVFDRQRLYVGGLDLNDRRYDTPDHDRAAEQTWHDVQLMLDGPIVGEAQTHLDQFEAITHGKQPHNTSYLLRTMSAKRAVSAPFLSPKTILSELADAHRDQVAQATDLIYLETQFFRDRIFAEQLAKRAAQAPNLSLILVLPAAPEEAAFEDDPSSDVAFGEHLQVKSLEIIKSAFEDRLFVGTPAQPRAADPDGRATFMGAPIVYVHAKVSIFDDRAAIVSSANLNGRSFTWDTEAGALITNHLEVAHLHKRCFDHWQGDGTDPSFFHPVLARASWAERARQNAARPPEERRGFILPYSADPAIAAARMLPGVPDEMV